MEEKSQEEKALLILGISEKNPEDSNILRKIKIDPICSMMFNIIKDLNKKLEEKD